MDEQQKPKRSCKPWYRSKTIWFNVGVAGLTALEASLGLIQAHVPGNAYAYIALALAVGNAMLRIITTQAVSAK